MTEISKMARTPLSSIYMIVDWRAWRVLQMAVVAKNMEVPQKMAQMKRQNHHVLTMALASGEWVTEDEACETEKWIFWDFPEKQAAWRFREDSNPQPAD